MITSVNVVPSLREASGCRAIAAGPQVTRTGDQPFCLTEFLINTSSFPYLYILWCENFKILKCVRKPSFFSKDYLINITGSFLANLRKQGASVLLSSFLPHIFEQL